MQTRDVKHSVVCIFDLNVTKKPVVRFESLSLAECLAGFEPQAYPSECIVEIHKAIIMSELQTSLKEKDNPNQSERERQS